MKFEQFQKKNYLNLETFRKSGQGVKTPVWFAQDGDLLYVWTQSNSGKAKRIRNNGAVNIAPCAASGEPLGEWIPARAEVDDSPQALERVRKLMKEKYGFVFSLFRLLGALRGGTEYAAIRIR